MSGNWEKNVYLNHFSDFSLGGFSFIYNNFVEKSDGFL